MKRTAIICLTSLTWVQTMAQQPATDSVAASEYQTITPVEVRAIRAGERAPFARTNLNRAAINRLNQGQDIPFLLNQTPSVVVNSDAGTGIGYTGLRIRGTDATRINITLNGIPFNDAESQGSFFVNLPDFSSSVQSIQVQRGVGTSSNGTAAFGATVSLSTNEINLKPYAQINNSYGSFNTWKHTIRAGSGLIDDKFTIDARLSRITSDGYIDRATSDLKAYYLSGAWLGKKSTLRLNVFSGKEITFQAWNGIPEAKLRGDEQALINHYYNNLGSIYFTSADSANLFNAANRTYNLPLYKNETDNYTQSHYQLFFDHRLNDAWHLNTAAFLTRGFGFYENYKYGEDFDDYGLPDLTVNGELLTSTDLVRRKWLDNYFYGQIFSAQYKSGLNNFTIGGAWTKYDGDHFGEITWARYGFDKDFRYYDLPAEKTDANIYIKGNRAFGQSLVLFGDIQYRHVTHRMQGFEDQPGLQIKRQFNFINPKAGISYQRNGLNAYISYALGNKEPNRDDFEAGATSQPKKETLHDYEAGVEYRVKGATLAANLYYMHYKDQLVLTGQVNDVGAYTRINVPNSYRAGIELQGQAILSEKFNLAANFTYSRNRIKAFTEYVDEYDADFEWIGQAATAYKNAPIAFSPDIIAAGTVNTLPVKNLEFSLIGKYVGDQYLDNTGSDAIKLDAYYTQDVRMIYTVRKKLFSEWNVTAQVNNVFNRKYEPNGYTYAYIYDGSRTTENFYFPMAGINFMIGLNITL